MHPILGHLRRLGIYLLAWVPLAILLAYLLVKTNHLTPAEAAVLVIPLALVYAFMCLSAWYSCRATPLGTTALPRLISTHLVAAIVISLLWVLIAEGLAAALSLVPTFRDLSQKLAQYYPVFAVGILLYLLSVALHYVLLAFEASREAERRALEAGILAREAELRALKAQVNPHFLFNSLHSISALTSVDAGKAREMCIVLAEFLRSTLGLGEKAIIPLGDELGLIRRFLAVEKIRFGPRLNLQESIQAEALSCQIPPLLLQPLIENAVWHGLGNLPEGGWIRLTAIFEQQSPTLTIVVENSFDPEAPRTRRNGMGLANVRRRIETRYGTRATFATAADGDCFRVTLTLPAETEETSS